MLNNSEYAFERELNKKQMELELNNTDFANYIGMHRTWVMNLWNQNLPRHPLSKKTMSKLYNRLNIDLELMVEYNKEILKERQ